MERTLRISGGAAIAVTVFGTLCPFVAAQTSVIEVTPGSTYRRTTTVIKNGVKTVTTETGSTPAAVHAEVTPQVFIGTLDARRVQLENAIAKGLADGTISAMQARRLRMELDDVSRAEAAGKNSATSFTYQSALPMAMILDHVGNVIHESVPTFAFSPFVSGTRFVISNGQIVKLDDIMVRRAELESRISRELAEGTLNSNQAYVLRNDLARIGGIERDMRRRGEISLGDSRDLYKQFDRVGSRLDGYSKSKRR